MNEEDLEAAALETIDEIFNHSCMSSSVPRSESIEFLQIIIASLRDRINELQEESEDENED